MKYDLYHLLINLKEGIFSLSLVLLDASEITGLLDTNY